MMDIEEQVKELRSGCGSHSCRRHKPKGMGVNGPCRCWQKLDGTADTIERLTAENKAQAETIETLRAEKSEAIQAFAKAVADSCKDAERIERLREAARSAITNIQLWTSHCDYRAEPDLRHALNFLLEALE